MITHEIIGDDMQAVVITMAAGDEVRAEAGAMTYMTDGITMDARMEGGILGGLKRKLLAGESLFLTFFRCSVPSAKVAFAGPYPGKIIRMPLQNSAVLCQRDPGVANWLDPAGYERGPMIFRWLRADAAPVPTTRVIAYDELAATLPDAARVTPQQRADTVARRRAAVRRRFCR